MDRSEILARLRERIVRFAASRIRGENAEDLAQDVLLVIHEKYPSLESAEDLVPLALEITRLKLWAARRKILRHGEDKSISVDYLPLAGADPDPFDLANRREQLQVLESALAGLSERCRELFRLKLEGHSFPEIRKRMGAASLNTLYTWDFRCRKELLSRMKKEKK